MVWAEVAGVAGAAAGAAEGRAGAWRTRFCAVAQVATQCSWPLVWAWIRPSVPSWAITRTETERSVTVQCLLRKNYNCWRGGKRIDNPPQINNLPHKGAPQRCRGKVESSAFRIVSDLVILLPLAAIPSINIVLHRAHPSRLPFGAQPRRGPDGTRSRCRETHSGMREWQPALSRPRWNRNFLLCRDTGILRIAEPLRSVIS